MLPKPKPQQTRPTRRWFLRSTFQNHSWRFTLNQTANGDAPTIRPSQNNSNRTTRFRRELRGNTDTVNVVELHSGRNLWLRNIFSTHVPSWKALRTLASVVQTFHSRLTRRNDIQLKKKQYTLTTQKQKHKFNILINSLVLTNGQKPLWSTPENTLPLPVQPKFCGNSV